MNKVEITERVLRVLAKQICVLVSSVSVDDSFEALGVDSLDAVELMQGIEWEFEIDIPEDCASFTTASHYIDFILANHPNK